VALFGAGVFSSPLPDCRGGFFDELHASLLCMSRKGLLRYIADSIGENTCD
jgi:hypothetical protein